MCRIPADHPLLLRRIRRVLALGLVEVQAQWVMVEEADSDRRATWSGRATVGQFPSYYKSSMVFLEKSSLKKDPLDFSWSDIPYLKGVWRMVSTNCFFGQKKQIRRIAVTFLILGVVWANFLGFWDKLFLTFGFPQIWKIWCGFLSKHEFQKISKFSKLYNYFDLQYFLKFVIIREKLISYVYFYQRHILAHQTGAPKVRIFILSGRDSTYPFKAMARQPADLLWFHVMILVGDFQKIRCLARRYPLRGSKNRFGEESGRQSTGNHMN